MNKAGRQGGVAETTVDDARGGAEWTGLEVRFLYRSDSSSGEESTESRGAQKNGWVPVDSNPVLSRAVSVGLHEEVPNAPEMPDVAGDHGGDPMAEGDARGQDVHEPDVLAPPAQVRGDCTCAHGSRPVQGEHFEAREQRSGMSLRDLPPFGAQVDSEVQLERVRFRRREGPFRFEFRHLRGRPWVLPEQVHEDGRVQALHPLTRGGVPAP